MQRIIKFIILFFQLVPQMWELAKSECSLTVLMSFDKVNKRDDIEKLIKKLFKNNLV